MALDFIQQMLNLLLILTLLRMIQVGITSRSANNPFGNALSFVLG